MIAGIVFCIVGIVNSVQIYDGLSVAFPTLVAKLEYILEIPSSGLAMMAPL